MHPAVAAAFAIAVAYLIAVSGPLLLFNPLFVSAQQARHDVPARLGVEQAVVDRVTREMLGDLFFGGDFAASVNGSVPILDDFERSHMRDVGGLVRVLAVLGGLSIAVVATTGLAMRRDRRLLGRLLVAAAGVVGAAAVVAALAFALAFDAAFLAFHRLFFREGTFTFGPESNLIRLFPEAFWSEASLAAGATIVATAVAAAVVGLRVGRAR